MLMGTTNSNKRKGIKQPNILYIYIHNTLKSPKSEYKMTKQNTKVYKTKSINILICIGERELALLDQLIF